MRSITFEFQGWSPKHETEQSFYKRTLEDFIEFLEEHLEAQQIDELAEDVPDRVSKEDE